MKAQEFNLNRTYFGVQRRLGSLLLVTYQNTTSFQPSDCYKRRQPESWDAAAGVERPLFPVLPDLRVSVNGTFETDGLTPALNFYLALTGPERTSG